VFQPKVSVMIPTYNQAKYIYNTVISVINQDYDNLEIVISDDASTDNTEAVVRKIINETPERDIKYIKRTENIGNIANYHDTLQNVITGDYVLNLDGDDFFIDMTYIRSCVELIEQHSDIKLVFARQGTYFEKIDKIVYDKVNEKLPQIIDGNKFLINFPKGHTIPHLTCLYRRKDAIELDFYSINIISSDWESILRLCINNKIGFINRHVGIWRRHVSNESRSINVNRLLENLKYITSVSSFARCNTNLTVRQLAKWKKKMLIRNLIREIITLRFLDKKKMKEFLLKLKDELPYSYDILIRHPYYWAARFVCRHRALCRFVFTYLIKQPSILDDLELYSSNPYS
jgi:glycosyltransferase involved in cell wall biosynthesis